MSLTELQVLLKSQPPCLPPASTDGWIDLVRAKAREEDAEVVQASLDYLSSDEALQSLEADAYWPKWNSPWWHIVVLHEMGHACKIPAAPAQKLMLKLQEEYSNDLGDQKAILERSCLCGFGNIFQALSAAGLPIEREFPWIRAWFLARQMPDGGLNCDSEGYHSEPPASSIVGTIAPLEAMLLSASRPLSLAEENFLDAGAHCLIGRKLMYGSSSAGNAEERLDEADWLKPCFPRFYFYDVLRGLRFILRWAEIRKKELEASAIIEVFRVLCAKSPDGQIRIEREAVAGVGSRFRDATGAWVRGGTATRFPLLEHVSGVGHYSAYLTAEWMEAKARAARLIDAGLII